MRAVHVALDPVVAERVRSDWERWPMPVPLEVIDAPFRSLEQPVLETVRAVTERPGTVAAVVVPEVASAARGETCSTTSARSPGCCASEPRVVITTVPLRRRL